MATTTFTDHLTPIIAAWLNDVNSRTYGEFVNVKIQATPAVGDGSTDDTAAIVAAFATAGTKGCVYFPAGTYKITSQITIPEDLTIIGDGKEISIIHVVGAIIGFNKTYASHTVLNRLNLVVRNMGFTGDTSALGAFKITSADFFFFDHCSFMNFTATGGYGLRFDSSWRGAVSNSHFENIKAYGVRMEIVSTVGCNATTYYKNEFIGNNQTGFTALLVRGQDINIINNDIAASGNGLHAMVLEDCEGTLIEGNYIESWQGSAITANTGGASRRVTVRNNVVNSDGVPCIDFDHASVNTGMRVYENRFPDMGIGQTCVDFGASTSSAEWNNDVDTSMATDTYTASDNGTTSNSYTGTGTLTGCTTSPTGTLRFNKINKTVVVYIPNIQATSNTTACTVTGAISDRLKPARDQVVVCRIINSGTSAVGLATISTLGVISLLTGAGSATFTNSGTKGVDTCTVTYSLE